MREAFEYWARGGPVMVPIAACAVLGLAVFLERIFTLRLEQVAPRGLIDHLIASVRAGDLAAARGSCAGNRSRLARVAEAGLAEAGSPPELVRAAMEERGRVEAAGMGRFLVVLGTIATISPLLGLLGTVTGLVRAFQEVVAFGLGDPGHLASGIWEALITTVGGLLVAIPAYVGLRLLQSRVEEYTVMLEEAASRLHRELVRPGGGG